MKLTDLKKPYLKESKDDNKIYNIFVEGECIKSVTGSDRANKLAGTLERRGVTVVVEADEPKADVSARAKLDHSLRAQGHKVVPDKKKELRKGKVKHKGKIEELRDIKIDSTEHEIVVKVGDDKSYTLFIDGKKIGEYSSFGQAKKEISKKIKNESALAEGPLVVTRDSDLNNMIDTFLANWKSKQHTDDEYAELLKALGYKMERDGQRTTLVKEEEAMRDCPCCDGGKGACSHGKPKCGTCNGTGKVPADFETEEFPLEEAPGAIRKGMAAVALIAGLWGVNNHMAQQAYDASPQLQKLTAYLEVAKEHNDQRMIDQLEQRIENHKTRLDLGKGEVMGKDGMPIDVKYDKDVDEAKQRLDPKCWKGYKKQGTKMKGGVRVNNCVPK